MALTQTPVTGQESKLYYNSATYASPTWVEITKCIDVTISITASEVTTNARESAWKLTRQGLKELAISWNYLHKQGTDTVFDAIRAAFFSRTTYELLALDGPATESGCQGIRAHCQFFSNTLNQGLEDASTVDFEAKPVYAEESSALVVPSWFTAS